MKLSQNFTIQDAIKSQTADRLGINNYPPEIIIPKLKYAAMNILEIVLSFYNTPIFPSSWYRCLELNRQIGSNDNSQHTKGEAIDFEIVGVDNKVLAYWCVDNLPTFDQLILEFYKEGDPNSGWVHCSVVENKNNRREILTIGKGFKKAGLPPI